MPGTIKRKHGVQTSLCFQCIQARKIAIGKSRCNLNLENAANSPFVNQLFSQSNQLFSQFNFVNRLFSLTF